MSERRAHPELEELVAAYSLDALDAEETSLVEEHLVFCPRCRAELAQHREVAALLAHTGASAPEGVWDRIANSLDDRAPDLPLARVLALGPRRKWLGRVAWGAVAAAAAAVIALLSVQVADQDQRIDDLAAAGADDALARAAALAVADPDAEEVALRSPDGSIELRVVVAEDGAAYLLGGPLPDLSARRAYQLWGQVDDELVSLGLLGPEPDVVPFRIDDSVTALAVTEERAGGVVQTRNRPVVVGERT